MFESSEPVLTAGDWFVAVAPATELDRVDATLDVFHYLQPQALLAGAALAEAFDRSAVGGRGRADVRELRDRERTHLATAIAEPPSGGPQLAAIADTLGYEWPRLIDQWDAVLGALIAQAPQPPASS